MNQWTVPLEWNGGNGGMTYDTSKSIKLVASLDLS